MYLILPHLEAEQRNIDAGIEIGLKGTEGGSTFYRWGMGIYDDELSYLDVGDGDGLTQEEIEQTVNEIQPVEN